MVSPINKQARISMLSLLVAGFAIFFFLFFNAMATNSGSNLNAQAVIWTNGTTSQDPSSANLTFGFSNGKTLSNFNFYFYANYTNSSNSPINDSNGNCTVRYNNTGIYGLLYNMSFNGSLSLWQSNSSFNYRQNSTFQVNCTGIFGNISLVDNFTIRDTAPSINKTNGQMSTLYCIENIPCQLNLSGYVSEDDFNDRPYLNFSAIINGSTTLTNYSLTSSGFLNINKSFMNVSANEQLAFTVSDPAFLPDSAILPVSSTEVNQAPTFTNLTNQTFNISMSQSDYFYYRIASSDEENNAPFILNLTFSSCTVAQWSTRDCSTANGRALFNISNSSQYSYNSTTGALILNFSTTRNDVGNYTLNFSIMDTNPVYGNNETNMSVVFNVLEIDQPPYFRYACDNERNTTEGSPFQCWINASDIDETNNITIHANESWFIFNGTGTNTLTLPANLGTLFNSTFLANFTSNDSAVGNWSINLSLTDTGSNGLTRQNSTIINFYVAFRNESDAVQPLNNFSAYTTNNYTIYVNGSDNNLLIPDKRSYNEVLTFTLSYNNGSNMDLSWINVNSTAYLPNTNITQASISIYTPSNIIYFGNNTLNLTVRDANNFSSSTSVFTIQILGNHPPMWNSSAVTNYTFNESSNFYLNLSSNVSDVDNDTISFSYSNLTAFNSFSINSSTGVINITAADYDVGYHLITIYASDGKTSTPLNFNFTIINVNEDPIIIPPLINLNNATIFNNFDFNASEDNLTQIEFYAQDSDLAIPLIQKGYYNESLSISTSLVGPNSTLFSFVQDQAFFSSAQSANCQQLNICNETLFIATFLPNRSDVGNYTVTLNISDLSNASTIVKFNVSIISIEHAPVLSAISLAYNSSIFSDFSFDVNATDVVDGNESSGKLHYTLRNMTSGGNFLAVNSSNGIITNTSSFIGKGGIWVFNISVNNSFGLYDYKLFNLSIYDYPAIIFPLSNSTFNIAENTSYTFNFSVSQGTNETLNYTLFIDGIARNSTAGNGNGTQFLWNFSANFSDNTCGTPRNLTLNVSNQFLSNSTTWNLSVSNSEAPFVYSGTIGGGTQTLSGDNQVSLNLADYFSNADASDPCFNRSIGFSANFINGTALSVIVNNWTDGIAPNITFSASSISSGNYSITAFEYNISNSSQVISNLTSNNFSVNIHISTKTVTVPVSGGGGGGAVTIPQPNPVPYALKIIVPGQLSLNRKDQIILPVQIVNNGESDLSGIHLTSFTGKNGSIASDISSSFSVPFIPFLKKGNSVNTTLTIVTNTENDGIYEIDLNASVDMPKFQDWGKVYLTVQQGSNVQEKIIFTEELIVANPECAEIKEVIDSAQTAYSNGNVALAEDKINQAINACKQAIAQAHPMTQSQSLQQINILNYILAATLASISFGIGYYIYSRYKLRKIFVEHPENF